MQFGCKVNNKHFVGETKNIKNRFPKHREALQNGTANKSLNDDFQKYGPSQFELIIFAENDAAEDNFVRKDLEKELQTDLRKHNLGYNSGASETILPRPSGPLPSSSGLYGIRCKINGGIYIGETKQRRGIAGRCNSHKSRLRNQNGVNHVLQGDWNLYGEENFEFFALEQGHQWNDDNKRTAREQELIKLHREAGGIVYNLFDVDNVNRGPSCPLALKETIIRNQTPEYRDYIRQLNTGIPNLNRKGVVCENDTYLSVVEAAGAYTCTPRVIRQKVNGSNPNFRWATEEEIRIETERREDENIVKPLAKQTPAKRSSGQSKRVQIDGVKYESVSKAAAARGVSMQAISKSLQKKRDGYYYLDDNDQPIPHS